MSTSKSNEQNENGTKKYKVYVHINKINEKKYIGITSQEPKVRWANGSGYKGCTAFYNAIQKYGWDEFDHKILFKDLTLDEACEKEIELIEKYQTTNKKYGYNISKGGKGIHIEYRWDEWKNNISKSHIGSLNPSARKIVLIDNEFNLIKTYECMKYASEELNVNITNIQYVCDKKSTNTGGYIFMYYEDYERNKEDLIGKKIVINPYRKKVNQLTLDGVLINTYSSIREAERITGINHHNITSALRGKSKTSGGYIWEYAI